MDTAKQSFTGSFNLPSGLSVDTVRFAPDGATAYVSNNGAPEEGSSGVAANGSVLVVDVASQKVTATIATPHGAGFEAMSPDGQILYTIFNNLGGASYLTAIDTTTATVAAGVSLPNGALKMFINPAGTRLYIYWFQGILVFDTATLRQIASIPTVGFSFRNNFATFAPDGRTGWFCNCGYGIYYNIDLRTNTVLKTVQGQDLGHGFMFSTAR
jgi:DNA-binding beta-propeller fold protein YncE